MKIQNIRQLTLLIVISIMLIVSQNAGNGQELQIQAIINQSHPNPVLFLHGWGGIGIIWNYMIEFFEEDGWPSNLLYAYDFEDGGNCSVQSNLNNANQIALWVDEILASTGAEKVDLVGHSMGGLSSRYYIKYLGGIDLVDDYVSIGSPQHGENYSSCGLGGVNDFVLLLNDGDETPGGVLNDIIGTRQDPVFFNRTYSSEHVPGTINYTSIYVMPDDASVPGISCPLDGANNVESEHYSHVQLIQVKATYERIISAIDGPFVFETLSSTTASTADTNSSKTSSLESFHSETNTDPIPWIGLYCSITTFAVLIVTRRLRKRG